ncbi:MAG: YceH family protein [Solirubrobacterales bacterium]|nr:YceH family protein [Solirubrobacterales bacterium]
MVPLMKRCGVLGCLVEKQRTTPDHYPLTLNALVNACNQSTNRDPVVSYDEATVRRALGELGRRRWIRSASGHSSRVPKYRQLFDTELKLDEDQLSVLAVLMLRGAQTPGELKQRTERLFAFHDLAAIQTTLDALISRGLAERLARRPGQKEERYRQLVGGVEADQAGDDQAANDQAGNDQSANYPAATVPADDESPQAVIAAQSSPEPLPVPADTPETERIEKLEREVSELRLELENLKGQLGA